MTTYDDIVLSHGPKLYLPLDDPSGTTAVALAGSNGTYTNSPTLGVDGPTPVGSDGITLAAASSQYVTATGSETDFSGAISVEFWILVSSAPGSQQVIAAKDNGSGNRPWIITHETSGKVNAFSNNATGPIKTTTGTLPTGSWVHFCWTMDASGNGAHYFDAVLDNSYTGGGTLPADIDDVWIGRGSSGLYLSGSIAAFAVYDYALTAAQVAQHYAAAPPAFRSIAAARAEELGAVLHLPLDDVGGTVIHNTIDTGLSGVMSGGPTFRASGPSDYLPHAVSLSGTSQYGGVNYNASGLTAMSIEAWALWSSTPAGDTVIAERFLGGADPVTLTLTTSNGSGGLGSGDYFTAGRFNGSTWALAYGTEQVVTSTWYHLVATHDGTTLRLYINGVETANVAASFVADSDTWNIGRHWTGTTNDHPGKIAAVSFYDRALTPAEVYENYRLGLDLAVGTAFDPVEY